MKWTGKALFALAVLGLVTFIGCPTTAFAAEAPASLADVGAQVGKSESVTGASGSCATIPVKGYIVANGSSGKGGLQPEKPSNKPEQGAGKTVVVSVKPTKNLVETLPTRLAKYLAGMAPAKPDAGAFDAEASGIEVGKPSLLTPGGIVVGANAGQWERYGILGLSAILALLIMFASRQDEREQGIFMRAQCC